MEVKKMAEKHLFEIDDDEMQPEEKYAIVSELEGLYEDISNIASNLMDVWSEDGDDPHLEVMYEKVKQKIKDLEEKYHLPSKLQFYDLQQNKIDDHDEYVLTEGEIDSFLSAEETYFESYEPPKSSTNKKVYDFIDRTPKKSPVMIYIEDSSDSKIFVGNCW